MNQQSLTIDHLSVSCHDRTLVNQLSICVHQGRTLALIGASGSGKSLSLAAILDLLPNGLSQTHGGIYLNQQPIESHGLRGRVVASIMQNPRSGFNSVRTIKQHAKETLKAIGYKGSAKTRDVFIAETFTQVGLDHPHSLLSLYPFELSGGMLQRIMIALALLSGAPFLFADEPTTDLDMVTQARVLHLLEQQVRQHHRGLLLVTHDMGVVARLADDVAVIEQGEVIETGPVETIFYHPQHPTTRELIQAHLDLYPHLEQPFDRQPQLDLPHPPVSTLAGECSVNEDSMNERSVDKLSVNKQMIEERAMEEDVC